MIIVVGGGIAGFYCALELLKRNKTVILCEKYKTVGGRIDTYKKDGYQWESGAGRISKAHTIIIGLMKKYKQPIVPISKDLNYKRDGRSSIEPNLFETNIQTFFEPLNSLDSKILANSTLKELCVKIHGKKKAEEYLDRFPYRAEVEVLRADLGLEVFKKGAEMASHEGYFVALNGLHKLIESMEKDFIEKGGKVLTNHTLVDIVDKKNYIESTFLIDSKTTVMKSEKIICAMESDAFKKIPFFKDFSTLKYLRMEPLMRNYAVYDKPWFSEYSRIVTKGPIRYFLPINYDKGIAMVSYTDSRDTTNFHNILKAHGEESLGNLIQNKLKELFGEIPKYKFFKSHYWKHGATYWLPGDYDPVKESEKSLKPFNSEVYVASESFSLKQAWMEGSVEQVKKMFDTYSF